MDDQQNSVVLIPAYNEQKTIQKIVDRCLLHAHHVIVIDDGSTDDTLAIIKNTRADIFSNEKNVGKGATLLKGFQIAIAKNYSGVITLDADGQHNPDDLPRFLQRIEQNPNSIVIGARHIGAEHAPKIRLFANKVADFFISLAAKKRLYDTQSGYRYYPTAFLKSYLAQSPRSNRFAFEAEILVNAVSTGLAVQYVDIESCYPINARASHYRSGKDTWQIAKVVAKLVFFKKG